MSVIGQILNMGTGGLAGIYKYVAMAGIALAALVAAYFYGHHEGALAGKAALQAYAAQRDKQDADLLGLNTITSNKIIIQYVDRVKVIHDNGDATIDAAHNNKSDANTVLSPVWTCIFNAAVNAASPAGCASLIPTVPVPGPNGTTIDCQPGMLCTK